MEIKVVDNPDGTILGDLNTKLLVDIQAALSRYMSLSDTFNIDRAQSLYGMLSAVISVLISIEGASSIPSRAIEMYITEIRKKCDLSSR